VASDDLIEIEGVVGEVFPGGTFKVKTEAGTDVHAHLAGKLRRFRIRVVLGDRVTVAVSPYDLSKGRIVFRHKWAPLVPALETRPGPGAGFLRSRDRPRATSFVHVGSCVSGRRTASRQTAPRRHRPRSTDAAQSSGVASDSLAASSAARCWSSLATAAPQAEWCSSPCGPGAPTGMGRRDECGSAP